VPILSVLISGVFASDKFMLRSADSKNNYIIHYIVILGVQDLRGAGLYLPEHFSEMKEFEVFIDPGLSMIGGFHEKLDKF
jgi:hypothetical protein